MEGESLDLSLASGTSLHAGHVECDDCPLWSSYTLYIAACASHSHQLKIGALDKYSDSHSCGGDVRKLAFLSRYCIPYN